MPHYAASEPASVAAPKSHIRQANTCAATPVTERPAAAEKAIVTPNAAAVTRLRLIVNINYTLGPRRCRHKYCRAIPLPGADIESTFIIEPSAAATPTPPIIAAAAPTEAPSIDQPPLNAAASYGPPRRHKTPHATNVNTSYAEGRWSALDDNSRHELPPPLTAADTRRHSRRRGHATSVRSLPNIAATQPTCRRHYARGRAEGRIQHEDNTQHLLKTNNINEIQEADKSRAG